MHDAALLVESGVFRFPRDLLVERFDGVLVASDGGVDLAGAGGGVAVVRQVGRSLGGAPIVQPRRKMAANGFMEVSHEGKDSDPVRSDPDRIGTPSYK